jgi:GNAT superfamily N-acetyltransferase
MADVTFHLRPAAPHEVIDLRHAVLRVGLPRDAAAFDGDELPTTHHVVAVDAGGAIVGCATMLASEWERELAWQVRGMAVAPHLRGTGVGRALLAALEARARASGPRLMWCNARKPAAPFYERLGWTIASEEFDIPTAGPHVKMTKRL